MAKKRFMAARAVCWNLLALGSPPLGLDLLAPGEVDDLVTISNWNYCETAERGSMGCTYRDGEEAV